MLAPVDQHLEERYSSRLTGSGAQTPSRANVCAECGEAVIYAPQPDTAANVRLICTVCLMHPARTRREEFRT